MLQVLFMMLVCLPLSPSLLLGNVSRSRVATTQHLGAFNVSSGCKVPLPGPIGPTGETGPTGPGSFGQTGPIGPTGADGGVVSPAFGTYWSIAVGEPVVLAVGDPVPFTDPIDEEGTDFTFDGTDAFTFSENGKYLVTYGASTDGEDAATFGLTSNGSGVINQTLITTPAGTKYFGVLFTASTIINITAGDTLQMTNQTGAAIVLDGYFLWAYIVIVKLSD